MPRERKNMVEEGAEKEISKEAREFKTLETLQKEVKEITTPFFDRLGITVKELKSGEGIAKLHIRDGKTWDVLALKTPETGGVKNHMHLGRREAGLYESLNFDEDGKVDYIHMKEENGKRETVMHSSNYIPPESLEAEGKPETAMKMIKELKEKMEEDKCWAIIEREELL